MNSNHYGVAGVCRSAWTIRARRLTHQLLGKIRDRERARLVRRIRDLEAENSRLTQLAFTDDLTGAYNRRHFDDQFRHDSALRARRHSLAFCLFDIDHFKAYNDSYGHGAGDDALRLIARVVMSQLRQDQDLLFRMGGDEFCVLLFMDSAAMALRIIDRVRHKVRELGLPHPHGRDGVLTVSFGVVWHDRHSAVMAPHRQLYLDADRVLYEAKRSGRDQIKLMAI
ncbi:diguanylate cyclase (GGDEF) domain-containing protein [Paraburkholderia phenazinium]|jgi:diguanylate cyclase (GGDEF)-like protein|uniref:diguanylate cyclase n=1 Tax=Paraburkholderia phenazinium TaxID=60549 RepID=A0A1G8FY24_9BURK|nr:diguanylate cyclase (GGDEF) domain-containing protein [Paraburkholderia phenazinium]